MSHPHPSGPCGLAVPAMSPDSKKAIKSLSSQASDRSDSVSSVRGLKRDAGEASLDAAETGHLILGNDAQELSGAESEDDEDTNKPKRSGRRKIKIEYIDDKSRRHITFSKRKAGIMKKAYELSTLTGTQVLLLVASETGHVYTFATPKLQPLITKAEGKSLIQACLNAPDIVNPPVPQVYQPVPPGVNGSPYPVPPAGYVPHSGLPVGMDSVGSSVSSSGMVVSSDQGSSVQTSDVYRDDKNPNNAHLALYLPYHSQGAFPPMPPSTSSNGAVGVPYMYPPYQPLGDGYGGMVGLQHSQQQHMAGHPHAVQGPPLYSPGDRSVSNPLPSPTQPPGAPVATHAIPHGHGDKGSMGMEDSKPSSSKEKQSK
ncbi:uncharacterized protein BJ171DRAFT_513379 [Polychytrium aggregatum]|uniref:uncharacterized protein n=1 Tax=Polychytrium aggregatum TaxID=110093 RepID=UPI0022FDCDFB|nr:uncharacterized protein BJ171DRAFT_513379 [Polychytrium aggregatum]KAI9202542.1 hypothetical protein BJ171DRAFT_513379 [Polychytrium aggregatum]